MKPLKIRSEITFQECKHKPRDEDIKKVRKNKHEIIKEELLKTTPHIKLTGINLYLYTDFNNCGFLVEKLDGDSNRRLQAVVGNTLEGRQCVSKGRSYVADPRHGSQLNMKTEPI